MSGGLRLTLVGPEAAPLVHRLMVAAFAEYDGTLWPPSGALRESVADVAAAIAAGGAAVAWLDGEPVGSARWRRHGDWAEIGRVAVLPEHRRRGIAAALVGLIEAELRRQGLAEARGGVRRALPGNIARYARLGYAIIAEEPHPLDPGAMSVAMAKRLVPTGAG